MADGDDARALRARVVDREHVDALVGVPVRAVEGSTTVRCARASRAIDVDVALEVAGVAVGVGGAGAQPRVAVRFLLRGAARQTVT